MCAHIAYCLYCLYCRERQRATIGSLEAELSAKLAALKTLTCENEKLKLRAAVLEATVNGREYHVSRTAAPRTIPWVNPGQTVAALSGSSVAPSLVLLYVVAHLSVTQQSATLW